MLPDVIATNSEAPARSILRDRSIAHEPTDSLFEHVAWLYAFCREKLFRDDTERIIAALWPNHPPKRGATLIEIGCGPGFYSRQLARRFPQIYATGVDRSESQVSRARRRAKGEAIRNCAFERVNALQIPYEDARFDVLIASRLFTVLNDAERAVAEMHRVLKPGGRCFIAEPRYAFWASIPLFAMWVLARATHAGNGYREPHKATVYSKSEFAILFTAQPWKRVKAWRDGRYQYALCEKA